jgi:hypothetical protein
MSTMAQPLTQTRPNTVAIAAAVLAVNIIRGMIETLAGGAPLVGIAIIAATTLLGLVAAYGLWTLRHWGMILTIVICTLEILVRAQGLLTGTIPDIWISALTGILLRIFILVLVLLPASRRAFR